MSFLRCDVVLRKNSTIIHCMETFIRNQAKSIVFPKIEVRLRSNISDGYDEIEEWADVDLDENRMSVFNSELEKMEYEWPEYNITSRVIKPNAKTGEFYESQFSRKETIFPSLLKGWSSVIESETLTEMPYEEYADYLDFNPHLETDPSDRFYITQLYTATATSVCGCEWTVNIETEPQPSWEPDIYFPNVNSWVKTPNGNMIFLEEHEIYKQHYLTTPREYHTDIEALVNIVETEKSKPKYHLDTCPYRKNYWKHEETTGNMIGIKRNGDTYEIISVCKAPTYENIHPVINSSFPKDLFWAQIQCLPETFSQEKIDAAIDAHEFFIIMPEPYEIDTTVTPIEGRVPEYI